MRADSAAAIQTDGIVGSAFIQVGVGTENAPVVSPGDALLGMDPVEFADLIQEGRTTFQTVATEISGLSKDTSSAIQALTGAAQTTTRVIDDVGQNVQTLTARSAAAVGEAQSTLAEAQRLMTDIRSGQGTIGRLMTDDALYQRVAGAARDVEQSMKNVARSASGPVISWGRSPRRTALDSRLASPSGARCPMFRRSPPISRKAPKH